MTACGDRGPLPLEPEREAPVATPTEAEIDAALAELNKWEAAERQKTDFASVPPFEHNSGSNPTSLAALPAIEGRGVGVLRGSSHVVLVDAGGSELARVPAARAPVDVAVIGGDILVVSEGSGDVQRFAATDRSLEATGKRETSGRSLRALAGRSLESVYVADSVTGVIESVDVTRKGPPVQLARCHDPIALAVTAKYLAANCASDHELKLWRGDSAVAKTLEPIATSIKHDGPIWALDTLELEDGTLLIALGGVEDRPLDRSDQGSFGYIDSYVFLYELGPEATEATRVAATNVAALGVITPKWVALERDAERGETRLTTAGYGSKSLVQLSWTSSELSAAPRTQTSPILPGTTDRALIGGQAVFANVLFDGWIAGGNLRAAAAPDTRSTESKIGELLFFTELMAPWGSSSERKSKFTCEACHFEGYVDGRTHFTGRDDVSATSRPLRGLFNNAPHFSRALDESTTEMVNNEFTVANKLNGRSPWFTLEAADFPWLARGGVDAPASMSPSMLRRALMTFLRDFTHGPNPAVRGRAGFSEIEARGATLFAKHCEDCHRAQLVAADERTRVAPPTWPEHIFSSSAGLVWGRIGYEKTGILPYVHEKGARPPTLRRLYKKWPYFTNGSAKSLEALVANVRVGGERFSHAAEAGGKALSGDEQLALQAFLQLL